MGRWPEWMFLKRICTHGQQAHEKMANALTIKEVKIKPTMSYYSIPTKMAIKKKKLLGAAEDMENLHPLYTVGGNVNCCSNYGK